MNRREAKDAFEQNFSNEIQATQKLAEANGKKVLVIGVWSAEKSDSMEEDSGLGGLTMSCSVDVTKRDAMVFIAGLEKEARRLRKIIGMEGGEIVAIGDGE